MHYLSRLLITFVIAYIGYDLGTTVLTDMDYIYFLWLFTGVLAYIASPSSNDWK